MSLNERNDVMKLREHESALRILRNEFKRFPSFVDATRLIEHHAVAIAALRQRINAKGKAA